MTSHVWIIQAADDMKASGISRKAPGEVTRLGLDTRRERLN
ncbi:hypothetical protein [Streptacidiphilus sp. EB129]